MCEFFSCMVDRQKKVYWREGCDNHHELVEKFKLDDSSDDQHKMKIARVEITPPTCVFDPIEEWVFRIDERIRPEWFTHAHEIACRNALKERLKDIDTYFSGGLVLSNYKHALPNSFTHCGGCLNLRDYKHKPPEVLK